jgi:serine/threonine protein phosphatase 1
MLDLLSGVDLVVMLGDYVNRGGSSRAVLDLLLEARHTLRGNLVLLRGNHEVALTSYLDEGDFVPFATHGGMATIRSYVGGRVAPDVHSQFRRSFPPAHERLLRDELRDYWETDQLLVSHVGYDPQKPQDRSRRAMVLQPHPCIFTERVAGGQLTVCGHYVQRSGRPFVRDDLICLDTGCGTVGGPLTAVLLPIRSILQV